MNPLKLASSPLVLSLALWSTWLGLGAPVQAKAPASANAPVPANAPASANAPVPAKAPASANAPVPAKAPASTNAPVPANAPISEKQTSQKSLISKKLKKTPLHQIARATMFNHFSSSPKRLTEMVKEFDITPDQKIARGLFVTLYKNGKTRACWGSISPRQADLVSATVYTTVDCLTKEYRYPPVKASELEDLKAQVTIVEKVVPVRSGATLHPLTDGLMVRSGGKGAVLLPGEASCPHYQVMQCKLKAGINPRESCQLYRIKAHVIR